MFTSDQLSVIKYCTEECIRQQSGMLSVYNMINAWDWASKEWDIKVSPNNLPSQITVEFIEHLGMLVEPNKNVQGFRTIPIFVGNGYDLIEKAPADRIRFLLTELIEAYYDDRLNPEPIIKEARINGSWKEYKKYKKANNAEDIFYFEYENIHPFVDGNGRSGKIILNYLRGSLNDPIMPPNFWNGSNP